MSGHTCHALGCRTMVPPRLHMCAKHWRMVPRQLQRRLWAEYRPGQERDMQPTPAYLRAVGACVRAVAEVEGHRPDVIAIEVEMYETWATALEAS